MTGRAGAVPATFLSIQAQDFIEEASITAQVGIIEKFLSIQVQDFIEESRVYEVPR